MFSSPLLQQIVIGSRVSPFTGEHEVVKKGRLVIYQNEFTDLGGSVNPESVVCRIYAPIDILARLRESGLKFDEDYFFPCLLFQGDTVKALGVVGSIIPDIQIINSDDDEVFKKYLDEPE